MKFFQNKMRKYPHKNSLKKFKNHKNIVGYDFIFWRCFSKNKHVFNQKFLFPGKKVQVHWKHALVDVEWTKWFYSSISWSSILQGTCNMSFVSSNYRNFFVFLKIIFLVLWFFSTGRFIYEITNNNNSSFTILSPLFIL